MVEIDPVHPLGVKIDPCYLSNAQDIDDLILAIERSTHIAAQPALSAEGVQQLIPGERRSQGTRLLAAIRAFTTTIYHPIGTCAMGNDKQSVVDSQLRVNGTANLYVADASVIPALPSGNPQSIVMMLAYRLATQFK